MRFVNLAALDNLIKVAREVVAADDAACAELELIGLEVPARTRELTEKLRAAIAKAAHP